MNDILFEISKHVDQDGWYSFILVCKYTASLWYSYADRSVMIRSQNDMKKLVCKTIGMSAELYSSIDFSDRYFRHVQHLHIIGEGTVSLPPIKLLSFQARGCEVLCKSSNINTVYAKKIDMVPYNTKNLLVLTSHNFWYKSTMESLICHYKSYALPQCGHLLILSDDSIDKKSFYKAKKKTMHLCLSAADFSDLLDCDFTGLTSILIYSIGGKPEELLCILREIYGPEKQLIDNNINNCTEGLYIYYHEI